MPFLADPSLPQDRGNRVPSRNNPSSICLRCGACLSVCPVYQVTGQERMSPRGKVHLVGSTSLSGKPEVIETISACLQCRACATVCNAGISAAALVQETRTVRRSNTPIPWWVSGLTGEKKVIQDLGRVLSGIPRTRGIISLFLHDPDILRLLPLLRQESAVSRLSRRNASSPHGLRIALFVGCIQNYLFPEIALAVTDWFGGGLVVPAEQTCCGLAAWVSGARDRARDLARKNLAAFRKARPEIIVTGCASCASTIRHTYPDLFPASTPEGRESRKFAEIVRELGELALELGVIPQQRRGTGTVTYHAPCHQRFALKSSEKVERVLASMPGVDFIPMEPGCCGYGGLFATRHPDLSRRILKQRRTAWERTGASAVVTTCSGCLLQLRLKRTEWGEGAPEVLHLAELASNRPGIPLAF